MVLDAVKRAKVARARVGNDALGGEARQRLTGLGPRVCSNR